MYFVVAIIHFLKLIVGLQEKDWSKASLLVFHCLLDIAMTNNTNK